MMKWTGSLFYLQNLSWKEGRADLLCSGQSHVIPGLGTTVSC